MKWFFYFTNKSKSKQSKSSLESKNQNNSDASSASRTTKSTDSLTSPGSISELYSEKGQDLRVFSLSELRKATNDFRCVIGEGAFGPVFKGTIRPADGQGESTVVAVKMLNQLSSHGHKQWLAEVQVLAVASHPNLVKLLGYCSVDEEGESHRLLVYEYMPNASLDNHLFSRKLPTLPWKKRLHIILGAAEGLAYLHEGLEIQVIHRDFKPSNVLLDENFNPKISDFGLAREGPTGDRTHVSTAAVGTHGYAAPEYVQIGHLSVKSDIWSFGVVLFEILTGRRALERNGPESEQRLLDWVKQFLADGKKFSMIIDPRLTDHYSLVAARRVARLATSCLNKNPKDRPTMREVVESLKQALQESEDWEPGPLT